MSRGSFFSFLSTWLVFCTLHGFLSFFRLVCERFQNSLVHLLQSFSSLSSYLFCSFWSHGNLSFRVLVLYKYLGLFGVSRVLWHHHHSSFIIHHSSSTTRLLDSFGAVSILITLELNISGETRFRVQSRVNLGFLLPASVTGGLPGCRTWYHFARSA